MRIVLVLFALLATALVFPAVASATHIVDVELAADCEGWSTDLTIFFRADVLELNGDFTLVLTNSAGDEIVQIAEDIHLTRDAGIREVTYNFAADWNVFAPADDYTVTVVFTIPLGDMPTLTEMTISDVDCGSVDTDESTWGTVKSLYR